MGTILAVYHRLRQQHIALSSTRTKENPNEEIASCSCNLAGHVYWRLPDNHSAAARATWTAGTGWAVRPIRAAGCAGAVRTTGPDRGHWPDGTNGPAGSTRPARPGRTMSGRTATLYKRKNRCSELHRHTMSGRSASLCRPSHWSSELRLGLSSISLFIVREVKRLNSNAISLLLE